MLSQKGSNKNKLWLVLLVISFLVLCSPIKGAEFQSDVLSEFEIFDADIRDVFRSLAELGDINVLLDPIVRGPVSIKLKHGLTIKESIDLLAQTHGFAVRWIPATRTAIVGNESTFLNFEVKETRVYKLNYADPEQVRAALAVIIPQERLGVDLRTNQLTIKGSILEHQNIEEIVVRLDREMPQINIEARVEEISTSVTRELGMLWSFKPTDSDINFRLTTLATLKALEEQNKAKILANPNISITDSQEGRIFIGDKFPIVTTKTTDKGIEYDITYIEVGTSLTVRPRINENDVVTVNVKAGVSNILEWKKTGNRDDVPVIRTREASSVIRLKEGETFILSGLNLTKEGSSSSGVPGLSKIPLFGRLFQNKKDGPGEETEVVIFLTPKIVKLKNEPKSIVSKVEIIGEKPNQLPPNNAEPKKPAVEPGTGSPVKQDQMAKEPPVLKPEKPSTKVDSQITDSTPAQNPDKPGQVTDTKEERSPGLPGKTVPPITLEMIGEKEKPVEEKEKVIVPKNLTTNVNQKEDPINDNYRLTVTVKIKRGDTIENVAKKYGVPLKSILQENGFQTGVKVSPAQEIRVPIPSNHLYQIKPKETIWRIAKRYGVTVELLMEINNISDTTKVEKGAKIILPRPVDKVVNNKF